MVNLALAIGELTLARQMKSAERNVNDMGGNTISLAHEDLTDRGSCLTINRVHRVYSESSTTVVFRSVNLQNAYPEYAS